MAKLGVGLPLQPGNTDDLEVVVNIFNKKNVSLEFMFWKAVLKEKH